MKVKFCLISSLIALTACAGAAASDGYKITVPLTPDDDDSVVFLVNYDSGQKLDSVTVADSKAVFTGKVDKPVVARLTMDGRRLGTFILENSDINLTRGAIIDSPLNKKFAEAQKPLEAIGERYHQLHNDSTAMEKARALQTEYETTVNKIIADNADNPIGYIFFVESAYQYSLEELENSLKKYPEFGKYVRVQKLLKAAQNKALTQPGKKFVDFEVPNDSTVQRLSDYVGKGKYVLVDFWASWCGPCIRETKVIKEILEEYGPKGLEVLGVAVWDEPENTLQAIKKHQLPWPQIINAQTIPTDLYGISAIPCIILFGPDGTIISRDKQDAELKADVAKALGH